MVEDFYLTERRVSEQCWQVHPLVAGLDEQRVLALLNSGEALLDEDEEVVVRAEDSMPLAKLTLHQMQMEIAWRPGVID